MAALQIIMGILLILAAGGSGALALLSIRKGVCKLPHLICLGGLGALTLCGLFLAIPTLPTFVIAFVFWILGLGGVVTGYTMLTLDLWKASEASARPEPDAPAEAE